MAKEHERREHLKNMTEAERKVEEQKFQEAKKKHEEHPKVHHPVSDMFDTGINSIALGCVTTSSIA